MAGGNLELEILLEDSKGKEETAPVCPLPSALLRSFVFTVSFHFVFNYFKYTLTYGVGSKACVPVHMWRWREVVGIPFSPSTTRAPGIESKVPGLVASAFA